MKILLLLCKGVEIYEAAAFYDVFGWANTYGNQTIKLDTVGVTDNINCTFGLQVKTDLVLSGINIEDYDGLAIPGGFGEYGFYDDAYSEPVLDFIRGFHSQDKPISSICVGALPIAKSGILDNKNATTYHLLGGHRKKQLADFKNIHVKDDLIVIDGNIGTSSCPVTSIDMAFWLLQKLTDKPNTDHIRSIMGFNNEK